MKLYIAGDSFTHGHVRHHPDQVAWMDQVAELLGQHHGCQVEVVNDSFSGVAQDFCWATMQTWEGLVQPEDYVIVSLTHPSRYWYIHEKPDLSNLQIIDMDLHAGPEMARAIEHYVRYIQRPSLDSVQLISRLGWLAYMVAGSNKWRRPLMLQGFEQLLHQAENYRELNFAKGDLYTVQCQEFEDPTSSPTERYFYGTDYRYNHLSLRNHKVMAEKVFTALIEDRQLDLTAGFHQGFITEAAVEDPLFERAEFNPLFAEHSRKMKEDKGGKKLYSWVERIKMKSMKG